MGDSCGSLLTLLDYLPEVSEKTSENIWVIGRELNEVIEGFYRFKYITIGDFIIILFYRPTSTEFCC
jgi:hypothetical protein